MVYGNDSILDELKLNSDDANKIYEVLSQLGQKSEIEIGDILNKTKVKKLEYYTTLFVLNVLIGSVDNALHKFTHEADTIKEDFIVKDGDVRNSIVLTTMFLHISGQESKSTRATFATLAIPIVMLFFTGLVPLSFCVETLVKLIKLHKLEPEEILYSAATISEFIYPVLNKGEVEVTTH